MILLPRELPDLRTRMAEYNRSRYAAAMHAHYMSMAEPDLDDQEALTHGEANCRLDSLSFQLGALYYINPDMVTLLMQAKDGIGETGFMEYDLPTPVGMAYLGADLNTWALNVDVPPDEWDRMSEEERREVERRRSWRAPARLLLLWHYMPATEARPYGWVRLAWYEDRDYVVPKMRAAWDYPDGRPFDEEKLRHRLGPFVFDGHQVIVCHPVASELKVERFDEGEEWRADRSDMFRALCFLLRQRVVETETVMPDRAARRRAQRDGKEPPPVRVISIRGAAVSGGTGDGQREWKHRWIVRGHWRRQWYRSIQAHRPVWIHPFVKGPDDAPLLGGEKVYSVRP